MRRWLSRALRIRSVEINAGIKAMMINRKNKKRKLLMIMKKRKRNARDWLFME